MDGGGGNGRLYVVSSVKSDYVTAESSRDISTTFGVENRKRAPKLQIRKVQQRRKPMKKRTTNTETERPAKRKTTDQTNDRQRHALNYHSPGPLRLTCHRSQRTREAAVTSAPE